MNKCTIIGISDDREQWFPPEVVDVIQRGRVFSGGKRHHEIMARYLPEGEWIDITVPLSDVFAQYDRYDDIVIFASGDPLFYGFASTVQRECPACQITVFPAFNSLQLLAHRMLLPYQDIRYVSLTGRPWDKFDEAVILGEPLIGVLTDRHHTPQTIWHRLHDFGYDNYVMTVGENLGNRDKERITEVRHTASLLPSYDVPNCVILRKLQDRPRPFGLPEQDFALLDGRSKMITKMPIRLLSLSLLDLRQRHSFWDVGFCTGSVSIEAKLQFPHLKVTSFEIREEGRELMQENARHFGTPGIQPVIGDFLSADLTSLPRPDAVFIGGHGGRLVEMIARLNEVMLPGAILVFNSVSDASRGMFLEGISKVGMTLRQEARLALDDHNPIHVLLAVHNS